MIHLFYKFLYSLFMIYCFFFRPRINGVHVAVWYQNKILMIKNSYRKILGIPAGRLKKNEEEVVGACRELREETGIKAKTEDLNKVLDIIQEEKYATDHIILFEYHPTELPEIQVDNKEVIWAQFMSADEAAKLKIYNPIREYILKKSKDF
ncbi:MAG: NUDIX hydrolase [Spirochaetes bacterium]|nr:NUDIX hydrolase [Spirochaetota bacterium]